MCRQTSRRPGLALSLPDLDAPRLRRFATEVVEPESPSSPLACVRGRRHLSLQQLEVSVGEPDAIETGEAARVLDWLCIAGEDITLDKAAMQRLGVTHIINCTRHCPNLFPAVSGQPVPSDGFHYLKLSLRDSADQDIMSALAPSFLMIEAARACHGVCLVHCSSGMSRSAAIVIAYLVQHRGMPLLEALRFTKERRRQCSPNPGFLSQLLDLEEHLHARRSVDLRKYCDDRFAAASAWERQAEDCSAHSDAPAAFLAPPPSRARSHRGGSFFAEEDDFCAEQLLAAEEMGHPAACVA